MILINMDLEQIAQGQDKAFVNGKGNGSLHAGLTEMLLLIEDVNISVVFEQKENGLFSVKTKIMAQDAQWPVVGFIDPTIEGLPVVREMILDNVSGWQLDQKNMDGLCTSGSHWKRASRSRKPTLGDKLCLLEEKMCYTCATEAVKAAQAATELENQAGFASLDPATAVTANVTLDMFDTPTDMKEWLAFTKASNA